jgi:hypothetical protein
MHERQLFTIAAALVVALTMVTDAVADSSYRGRRHAAWRHHAYRYRAVPPVYVFGAPDRLPMSPNYRFHGYGAVPDGCNLPTNLCPNELRDIP